MNIFGIAVLGYCLGVLTGFTIACMLLKSDIERLIKMRKEASEE